ncbi:hypothetical protein JHW43_008400 [Diplocarpon mali]|nr:hypothetical protein JHW43_008400 [Diplocarpon mali]
MVQDIEDEGEVSIPTNTPAYPFSHLSSHFVPYAPASIESPIQNLTIKRRQPEKESRKDIKVSSRKGKDAHGFRPTSAANQFCFTKCLERFDARERALLLSAKLVGVCDQVQEWISKTRPQDKINIYTRFRHFQVMIGCMLEREKLHIGDTTAKQREETIAEFRDDPTIKIVVAGFKCGGLGLNLSFANRVDVWWNVCMAPQDDLTQKHADELLNKDVDGKYHSLRVPATIPDIAHASRFGHEKKVLQILLLCNIPPRQKPTSRQEHHRIRLDLAERCQVDRVDIVDDPARYSFVASDSLYGICYSTSEFMCLQEALIAAHQAPSGFHRLPRADRRRQPRLPGFFALLRKLHRELGDTGNLPGNLCSCYASVGLWIAERGLGSAAFEGNSAVIVNSVGWVVSNLVLMKLSTAGWSKK